MHNLVSEFSGLFVEKLEAEFQKVEFTKQKELDFTRKVLSYFETIERIEFIEENLKSAFVDNVLSNFHNALGLDSE